MRSNQWSLLGKVHLSHSRATMLESNCRAPILNLHLLLLVGIGKLPNLSGPVSSFMKQEYLREATSVKLLGQSLHHNKYSLNWTIITIFRKRTKKKKKIERGLGLPRWLKGKEPASWCRRLRFDPWVGKIYGEENGNPLQYYCLDRGAWGATVHGVTRSWTQVSD